jgi:hypothetical protein
MAKRLVITKTAGLGGAMRPRGGRSGARLHPCLGVAFALLLAASCSGEVPDGLTSDENADLATAQAGLSSCSDLGDAEGAFADYVESTVSTGNVVEEPGSGNAHATLRIDAVTTALAGQPGLVDAVMTLETSDPDVRFVAPANMPNATVYFQQGAAAWDVLSADQTTQTGKVQIRTYDRQGAMVPPVPLSNGATFRVGVRFLAGAPHAFDFSAAIAYRPDWLKAGQTRPHQFTP